MKPLKHDEKLQMKKHSPDDKKAMANALQSPFFIRQVDFMVRTNVLLFVGQIIESSAAALKELGQDSDRIQDACKEAAGIISDAATVDEPAQKLRIEAREEELDPVEAA
jgi:hypothetical protein